MKKMWIQLKPTADVATLKKDLAELGRIEEDPAHAHRLILAFHNQSESGIRSAGFRLTEDYVRYFDDFDMIRD